MHIIIIYIILFNKIVSITIVIFNLKINTLDLINSRKHIHSITYYL